MCFRFVLKQAALLAQHIRNLLTYTDGSMLEAQVGAGLYVNPTTRPISHRENIPLGNRGGVRRRAIRHQRRSNTLTALLPNHKQATRCVELTDNQAAIMRIANLKPGPGQETAVAVAKASNAPKALNNSTITSPSSRFPATQMRLETKLRTA